VLAPALYFVRRRPVIKAISPVVGCDMEKTITAVNSESYRAKALMVPQVIAIENVSMY
jgi:hypothetical protein